MHKSFWRVYSPIICHIGIVHCLVSHRRSVTTPGTPSALVGRKPQAGLANQATAIRTAYLASTCSEVEQSIPHGTYRGDQGQRSQRPIPRKYFAKKVMCRGHDRSSVQSFRCCQISDARVTILRMSHHRLGLVRICAIISTHAFNLFWHHALDRFGADLKDSLVLIFLVHLDSHAA